jgi:hypothetical protein
MAAAERFIIALAARSDAAVAFERNSVRDFADTDTGVNPTP